MKDKKKISLIIPMYNVEEYLEECLDSVVNQDYGIENIEVILIDDGSSDGTLEIAKKYVRKYGFILLINSQNSGQAISRNNGIKKASGEYIAFLDSDDMLSKNNLSSLYEEAVRTDADIVVARLNSFDSKGEYGYYSDKFIKERKVTNIYDSPELLDCISICSKLYKADVIKNVEFLSNTYHEDNSFTMTALFEAKKIAIYPEYLYLRRYREGENKSTMQKLNYKTFNDLILNFRETLKNVVSYSNLSFLYKHMIKKLNNYMVTRVKKEDYKRAKKDIKKFVSEIDTSNFQKKRLEIFNGIYCFVANVYGRIKKG